MEEYNFYLDDIKYWYQTVNMKINSRESWRSVLSKVEFQDLELFHKRLKMLYSKKAKIPAFEVMHEFKVLINLNVDIFDPKQFK